MSPSFTFSAPTSPYIGTIADLMGRQSEIQARAAQQVADAQARALYAQGQAGAQMWQGVGQGISQVAQIPLELQRYKSLQQEQQLNALKLQSAQREAAGREAYANILQPSQLGPTDVGPRQESYVDPQTGMYDIPKLSARLNEVGFADQAGTLVKHATDINSAMQEAQDARDKSAKAQAVLYGHLANSTNQLVKMGVAPLDAMDLAAQGSTTGANPLIKPADYQQFRTRFEQFTPDQQQAALTTLMDTAARLSPTKTLAEGAQEVDIFGRVVAKGGEKPPTEAELAWKASGGDPTKAMQMLK